MGNLKKFIFGLFKQGVSCIDCKMASHYKCKDFIGVGCDFYCSCTNKPFLYIHLRLESQKVARIISEINSSSNYIRSHKQVHHCIRFSADIFRVNYGKSILKRLVATTHNPSPPRKD